MTQQHAAEVDRGHLLIFFQGYFAWLPAGESPGYVQYDVDLAECLQCGREGRLNFILLADVGVEWNDISRGMARKPQANDEEQMRAFWRHWNEQMIGALR